VSGRLRTLQGGAGPGLLLLLHGLGATADVWTSMAPALERGWPGRWTAVDLPGHGGSLPLSRVSFGALAAAVADEVPQDEPVVVLGHSLGGVVALALASGWFGIRVSRAVGVGIKAVWSADELAKAQALATRPVSWFDDRAQAVSRHLLVAGLTDSSARRTVRQRPGCASGRAAGASPSTRGPSASVLPTCRACSRRRGRRSCSRGASTTPW
jgi:pimeloyl-ACP methyl ester carboxylesterase